MVSKSDSFCYHFQLKQVKLQGCSHAGHVISFSRGKNPNGCLGSGNPPPNRLIIQVQELIGICPDVQFVYLQFTIKINQIDVSWYTKDGSVIGMVKRFCSDARPQCSWTPLGQRQKRPPQRMWRHRYFCFAWHFWTEFRWGENSSFLFFDLCVARTSICK